MRDPVIRTEGLTKRYGGLVAVDGVDLRVDQGDLFGFLGPNGSGKTTTVRMLLGLVFATSGRIEVLGRPMPRAARRPPDRPARRRRPEELNRQLVAGGVRVRELLVERPSLEDVFLELTTAGGSAPRRPPDRVPGEWGDAAG